MQALPRFRRATTKLHGRTLRRGHYRLPRPDGLIAKWGSHLSPTRKTTTTVLALLGFVLFMWAFYSIVGPLLLFGPVVYFTWNRGSRITRGEARWLITCASVGTYFLLCKILAAGILFLLLVAILLFVWGPPLWERRGGGNYREVFSLEGGFRFHAEGAQERAADRRRRLRGMAVAVIILLPVVLVPTVTAAPTSLAALVPRGPTLGTWFNLVKNAFAGDTSTSKTSYIAQTNGLPTPPNPPLFAPYTPPAQQQPAPAAPTPVYGPEPAPVYGPTLPPSQFTGPPAVPTPEKTLNHQLADALEGALPFAPLGPLLNILRNPPGITRLATIIPETTPAPSLVEKLKDTFIPPNSVVVTDPQGREHLTQGAPPASPVLQGAREVIRQTVATFSIALPPVVLPPVVPDGYPVTIVFQASGTVASAMAEVYTRCGNAPVQIDRPTSSSWVVTYRVDCRGTATFRTSATSTAGLRQSVQGAFQIPAHAPVISELLVDKPVPIRTEDGIPVIPAGMSGVVLMVGVSSPDASPGTITRNVDGILVGGDVECDTPSGECGWPILSDHTPINLPPFPPGSYTLLVKAQSRYNKESETRMLRFIVEPVRELRVEHAHFQQVTGKKDVIFTASYACEPEGLVRFHVNWGNDGTTAFGESNLVRPCDGVATTRELVSHSYAAPGTYYVVATATLMDANSVPLLPPVTLTSGTSPFFGVLVTDSRQGMTTETGGSPSGGGTGTSDPSAPPSSASPATPPPTPPPSEPGSSTPLDNGTAAVKNALNAAEEKAASLWAQLTSGRVGFLFTALIVGVVAVGGFWLARQHGLLGRWGIHPAAPAPPPLTGFPPKQGWFKRLFRPRSPSAGSAPWGSGSHLTFNLNGPPARGRDVDPEEELRREALSDLDEDRGWRGGFRKRGRKARRGG